MRVPQTLSKRDQIIQAAAQLVHIKGYHRTSVDDILVAAEAGKGQFYHYFKSKDEVGLAIVERAASQIHSTLLERLSQGRGLDAIEWMLDHLISAASQTRCEGGCPLGNLAAEMSANHEGFRVRLARIFEAWRVVVERTLLAAQQRGEIAPDVEVEEVAFLVLSTVEGGILLAKVEHDVRVMERSFDGLKRCLRRLERTTFNG